MCGITGIVNFKHGNARLKNWLTGMTNVLQHRGPDDEGYVYFSESGTECMGGPDTPSNVWESRHLFTPQSATHNSQPTTALGHRRLSILDTSAAGHQPMCDLSGRFWIVFNGEIYNYKEVKAELLLLGHAFQSHCDTEVIIQAYIAWGKNCILKFNGMWAFTIYDRVENSLFCSRDRFGVKPFYYFISEEYFAFASEIKALITLPFIEKSLNEKAVFDYLVLGQTELEPEGFFKGIFELEPASCLIIKNGKSKIEKYYALETNTSPEKFSESKSKEYIDQVSYLIYESVKLRLRSEVPVGACLSGGVDSSALVCTANSIRKTNDPFHVFTSVFPGSPIDESFWAKKVVEATSSQWHTIETKPEDLFEEYEKLIYTQDIPFFGSSTLSQSKVMSLIHNKGIKVTLDGQGADELFSGYAHHYYAAAWGNMKNLDFSYLPYLERAEPNANFYFTKYLGKRAFNKLPSYLTYKNLKQSKYDFDMLYQGFWSANYHRFQKLKDPYLPDLNSVLKNEFAGPRMKYLMKTADRNSMQYSVESRVPFADDHKLAEYVFSLPSCYKIHKGENKYLLRESMKGIIPESIRLRKDKKGFSTPELKWFSENRNEMKQLVSNNLEPFVDTKKLFANWDYIFDKKLPGNTLGISRFVILSLWRKRFGI